MTSRNFASLPASTCLALLLMAALGGCGGAQAPVPAATSATSGVGDATTQVGDVEFRASVVQTSSLPESVARQYGIERDSKTILLLVAVRKGPASAIALPAQVDAQVTDLRGGRQSIAMRRLQVANLVDSIGTTSTTLPDTLRFDVTIAVEGMAPVGLRFTREFYPQ